MADYIKYDELKVTELKELLRESGLSTKGKKQQQIETLKAYYKDYEKTFNELFDKYVPSQGAAATRQGKLLRAVARLINRYYNDGDSFSTTKDDYPEPFRGLQYEDKDLISEYYVGDYTDDPEVSKSNNLTIAKFTVEVVKRVQEIENEEKKVIKAKEDATESYQPIIPHVPLSKRNSSSQLAVPPKGEPKDKRVMEPKTIYIVIMEKLDPRFIDKVEVFGSREEVNSYINRIYNMDISKDNLYDKKDYIVEPTLTKLTVITRKV
jgi:hypothetical protein